MPDFSRILTVLNLVVILPLIFYCNTATFQKRVSRLAERFHSRRRDIRDLRTRRTPMNVFSWRDPVIEPRSDDEVIILGTGLLEHLDDDGRHLSTERINWPVFLPNTVLSENPDRMIGVKELRVVCFAKSFQSLDIVYHDGTELVSVND